MLQRLLVLILLGSVHLMHGATYTWNGGTSTAWNVGANWTGDGGWPDGNNDIAIINALGGNQCHLHANETIDEIYVSGTGYLDLGGFELYADDKGTLTGGNVGNGSIRCGNLTEFTNTTTFGTFTFTKRNAGGHITWSGGNTFNGPVTIINQDNNRRIRMANTTGDVFNNTAHFRNENSNWIQVAYGANCTFAENVTFENTNANADLSFGENGGTSTLAAGKSLSCTGWASGDNLYIYNVTSPGTGAFGTINTSDNVYFSNSTINGDITVVIAGGNRTFRSTTSTLNGSLSVTADNIDFNGANTVGTLAGETVTLVRTTGGGNMEWDGGNTWGPFSLTNQDNSRIRVCETSGDVFQGTVTLVNSTTGNLHLGRTGATTIADDVTITNSSTGYIAFGDNGGTTVLAAGKSLISASYATGSQFICRGVTSPGTTAFGTVSVNDDINFTGSSINGDIVATSSQNNHIITLNGTTLSANATLTADNIQLTNANNCANVSGTCTIVRNDGGGNRDWTGGNTFGNLSITNHDATDRIRLSLTNASTFNGTCVFNNTSNGSIRVSYNGANSFADDVTISNTGATGYIEFGGNGGTSVLAAGKSLTTSGYATGLQFSCRYVTSPGTAAFGTVSVRDNIDFTGSSINGNITAVSADPGHTISLNVTTLSANTSLTADNVNLTGANNCATVSGTCTITKNDGGGDNNWTGGNTFGTLVVVNNDTDDRIRLSNTNGSTFNGTCSFTNASSGQIDISFNGASNFADDVTITNSNANGYIRIGESTGTSTLAAGKSLIAGSYAVGSLFDARNVTSPGTTAFGTVSVTGDIDLTGSSINGNATFSSSGANEVITLNGTTLSATTSLTADNVHLNGANNCSTVSGTCTITKNDGGNDDDWAGGNTFGNVVITNNDVDDRIMLSNASGSTFNGTAQFVNASTGQLRVSENGTSTFAENVSFSNTGATGYVSFGYGAGVSTLAAGKSLIATSYAVGDRFICERVTSPGTTAFGTVSVTNQIDFRGSSINGNVIATSSGANQQIYLDGTTLSATTTLTADNVQLTNANNCANVSGTCTITKNDGGDDDDWTGGNTFGNLVVTNNDADSHIRLSNTNGSTFSGTSTFNNTSSDRIIVADDGASTFADDVSFSNTNASGYIAFGLGTGTGVLAAGKSLISTSYAVGDQFICERMTSPGGTAFGTVNVTGAIDFRGSSIAGDVVATTTGGNQQIYLDGTTLSASATLTGDNVQLTNANSCANASGTCTITKTDGGDDDNWTGGNTFGTLVFTNQDNNNHVRFSNTNASTFNGTVTINNTGNAAGGDVDVAYNGTSNFAENVTINNTNANGAIEFGVGGGSSTLAAGKSLIASTYAVGDQFRCFRVTSPGTTAFGTVNVTGNIDFTGTSINGDIVASSTGGNQVLELDGTTLSASATLSADNVQLNNANNCSTVSGTCTITKNDGGDNDDWTGGNTFGTLIVTNNDVNNRIRLAQTNGSTFNGVATFNNAAASYIDISDDGVNNFAENVVLNNTDANGYIRVGQTAGTTVLAAGKSFYVGNYQQGSQFVCNGVTSPGTIWFGEVITTGNQTYSNTTISAPIYATATADGSDVTFTSATMKDSITVSADDIFVTNGCSFATTQGYATFTKGDGNNGDNDWAGGCTFGDVTIRNLDANRRISTAQTTGDTYNGNALFLKDGAGDLRACRSGTNVFKKDLSTLGSTNVITFGQNTGVVSFTGTTTQNLRSNAAAVPIISRWAMNSGGGGSATLQGPINVSVDLTLNTGKITTDVSTGKTLTLTDENTTASIGNANSYVVGELDRIYDRNSGAGVTMNFPIGSAANHTPLQLYVEHNSATDYTYRGYVTESSALDLLWTKDPTIYKVSNVRYYDMSRYVTSTMTKSDADLRTGAGDRPILTIHYQADDGVTHPADLRMVKNVGGANHWVDIGGVGSAVGSGTISSTSTPVAFTSFSKFALATAVDNNPLPVEIIEFDAVQDNGVVNVEFTTGAQVNNDFFTIERSIDGVNWEPIGTIEGEGTTTQYHSYVYVDLYPGDGVNYYRVRQTDFDGTESETGIETVEFNEEVYKPFDDLIAFPNPASTYITVRKTGADFSDVRVYNSVGQAVDLSYDVGNNADQITLNIESLDAGLYIVTLGKETVKFYKQ